MDETLDKVKGLLDVNTTYGLIVTALIPVFLWWFSTTKALHETGLLGEQQSRTSAITVITNYVDSIQAYNPEPIIIVFEKKNGVRESRLVVRAMGFEEVANDVVKPFIFPALMGVLFCCWGVATILRLTAEETHSWRKFASRSVMVGNIGAIVWYVGLRQILTHVAL